MARCDLNGRNSGRVDDAMGPKRVESNLWNGTVRWGKMQSESQEPEGGVKDDVGIKTREYDSNKW